MPIKDAVVTLPEPAALERRLRALCVLERIGGIRFPLFVGVVDESRFRFRFDDGSGGLGLRGYSLSAAQAKKPATGTGALTTVRAIETRRFVGIVSTDENSVTGLRLWIAAMFTASCASLVARADGGRLHHS